MACPALPLCGLAIGEAERSIPDVNRRLRALLDRLGLPETTTVRGQLFHVHVNLAEPDRGMSSGLKAQLLREHDERASSLLKAIILFYMFYIW